MLVTVISQIGEYSVKQVLTDHTITRRLHILRLIKAASVSTPHLNARLTATRKVLDIEARALCGDVE